MCKPESCTYLGGFCDKSGRCLIEETMRNQMLDGKSWIDPGSERVKQKIARFIEAARENNCMNLNTLQLLIKRFQAGEPLD